jgi:hypothetical protein
LNENLRNIDRKLETNSQRAVARLVASLPEESPSMVWRSGLNEALLAVSVKQRRRHRFLLIARPALALAAMSAFALVMFMRPTSVEPASPKQPAAVSSLAASLLDLHQNDVRTMDVAGVGLDPNEPMVDTSVATPSPSDDSEADLEL